MPQNLLERGVGEDQLVVVQADPVGGRSVTVPPVEAVERSERHREDHEGQEHNDRRSGQEHDLESHLGTATAARSRAQRSRGRGLGRAPDSGVPCDWRPVAVSVPRVLLIVCLLSPSRRQRWCPWRCRRRCPCRPAGSRRRCSWRCRRSGRTRCQGTSWSRPPC